MKKIELDEKCSSCDGTGLYVGMAERDGYSVVCYNCHGTGIHHFVHEYEEFSELQLRDGVTMVLQCNPGIVVGGNMDFGGIAYEQWLEDFSFPEGSEMREFTCPAWWYQITDYDKRPEWEICWNNLGRTFSNCELFNNKHLCWRRRDLENK